MRENENETTCCWCITIVNGNDATSQWRHIEREQQGQIGYVQA